MSGLWTAELALRLPRARVPEGDLRLSDGRLLRRRGDYRGPAGTPQQGGAWTAQDGLVVIASLDETPHGGLLHVSCSYARRDPSWADIRAIREAFFPDAVDVMMVLPRPEYYVNLHEHCFHLWETPKAWGLR